MAKIDGFKTIGVESLTPHIGAQVSGIDLTDELSNEQFSEIYQAWLDWKVLVFRDQLLDAAAVCDGLVELLAERT